MAELHPETRRWYEAHRLSYDWSVVTLVLDALEAELAEAYLRGTSLRLDQLQHVHADYLKGIKGHRMVDPSWQNLMAAELIRRGA